MNKLLLTTTISVFVVTGCTTTAKYTCGELYQPSECQSLSETAKQTRHSMPPKIKDKKKEDTQDFVIDIPRPGGLYSYDNQDAHQMLDNSNEAIVVNKATPPVAKVNQLAVATPPVAKVNQLAVATPPVAKVNQLAVADKKPPIPPISVTNTLPPPPISDDAIALSVKTTMDTAKQFLANKTTISTNKEAINKLLASKTSASADRTMVKDLLVNNTSSPISNTSIITDSSISRTPVNITNNKSNIKHNGVIGNNRLSYVNPGTPLLTEPWIVNIYFTPHVNAHGDLDTGGNVFMKVKDSEWVLQR